jgi:hypothetical protein
MGIRIENMHSFKGQGIRIDRKSPVGNPFWMKDESMRDEVCLRYRPYFADQMKRNAVFYAYIVDILDKYRRGEDVVLLCWCAPKKCHGETIVEWIKDQEDWSMIIEEDQDNESWEEEKPWQKTM